MSKAIVKSYRIRVRDGRTLSEKFLDVPHLNGEITFASPAIGPSFYASVASRLRRADLILPKMSHYSSLVYAAWHNPAEKYSQDVLNILRNKWLLASNGVLYVPNEGAYIEDSPKMRLNFFSLKWVLSMKRNNLVKRLESGDKTVRFVPFGYKIEEQSPRDLARNQFLIGLAGEEGAEKLAKVAGNKYGEKPYLASFKNVDTKIVRPVGLSSNRVDLRLYVFGYNWLSYWDGYAFGKLPNRTRKAA